MWTRSNRFSVLGVMGVFVAACLGCGSEASSPAQSDASSSGSMGSSSGDDVSTQSTSTGSETSSSGGSSTGGSTSGGAEPSVAYYYGTVTVSSPDGAPLGTSPGLAKRTTDPERGTIEEVVLDEGALHTTTLVREGDTLNFAATAEDGSFTGVLHMHGEPWAFTGWTYDLVLTDGSGTIEGEAVLDADGLHTEKLFIDATGVAQVQIVDELAPITEAEYEVHVAELVE